MLPIEIRRRIRARVAVSAAGCWEWQRRIDADGYARLNCNDGRSPLAHRHSYEVHVGPIPAGLQIDHLCMNRKCVNPSHLRTVSASVNRRKQKGALATHCKSGHELTGRNLIIRKSGVWSRQCRECANASARKYQSKKRIAA